MSKASPLGLIKCPDCGFPDAEVRKDKSGHLYRHCQDGCGGQFFTHGRPDREKYMREQMRTPTATEPAGPAPKAEPKAAESAPVPAKRRGFPTLLGGE